MCGRSGDSRFPEKAMARQEAENAIKRRGVSFGGAGQMIDWLRVAGLDKIGNAELGDGADRAAEGGAGQNPCKLLVFLLRHEAT